VVVFDIVQSKLFHGRTFSKREEDPICNIKSHLVEIMIGVQMRSLYSWWGSGVEENGVYITTVWLQSEATM
jgi:hypothetical protein